MFKMSMLTQKEIEVIKLLADKAPSNKELARAMSVTIKTAENYMRTIREKTGLNRTELVVAYYKGELKDYLY